MSFGAEHYVPVLKVKRGEKAALQSVAPLLQAGMTPLLEIVERRQAPTVAAHLETAFKQLAASVRPYSRCFIDTREIAEDGSAAVAAVFERASATGMVFTPVTGISRSRDVSAALHHRRRGIALRLTREELESGRLAGSLRGFMTKHRLVPEDVDLIMDLGPVNDLIPEGVSASARAFMAEVPDHARWRTFTVSACAFPKSMGGVDRQSHAYVERSEWVAWQELHAQRQGLARLPTFSDCVIQHPSGVEGFDPRFMQASASIRYTLDDTWLLIKGVGTRAEPPTSQFPRLATQLVYGHRRSDFAGEGHCSGCKSMKAAADGLPKLGSPEVWRRLGTIHHITKVTRDLRMLPST